MPVSPTLRNQATYPFVRLNQAAAERRAAGLDVFDFGMGDPREPTDERILEALRDGVRARMGYPAAPGLPELREAIADWARRRFEVELDPDRHVVPTLGSKEAIFSFAQVVLDIPGGRDTVLVTEPGYPVPGRGAAFAGARVVEIPLLEANGFLPDLESVAAETWSRAAVLWVNYPNNPTGVIAQLDWLRAAAAIAREHSVVIASDEAYTELYTGEPPPSALALDDWTDLVVFNTLSKRSSMTGFRSGFVAGDPELVAALKQYRPNTGTAPQEFVQRASVVAWRDETHVERARASYTAKRALFSDVLSQKGVRVAGGDATMYMWVAVPAGASSEQFCEHLLEHGVLVTPGSYLGPSGEGYFRIALVPTLEECEQAVAILDRVL